MSLNLNTISFGKKKHKRLGRGAGTGKGTFSGRGQKGQRARSGGKGGLKLKGFKRNLLNIPKMKGVKSHKEKPQIVKMSVLEKWAEEGVQITPGWLFEKKLIKKSEKRVKILADKEVSKKMEIFGCTMSAKAKESLIKFGGQVIEMEEKKANK